MVNIGSWGSITLDNIFQKNAYAVPERMAVTDAPNRAHFTLGEPIRWSYFELQNYIENLACCFLENGLKKDDIVTVQLPNIVELVAFYLTCARIGLIANPLPIQYKAHEIHQVLPLTGSKAVVTSANIHGANHAQMFSEMLTDLPDVRQMMEMSFASMVIVFR